jgi:hypothetical protein
MHFDKEGSSRFAFEASQTWLQPTQDETEDLATPGYRNYLIFTDESGIDKSPYYAFGSLWLPYERRGDFVALIRDLRTKHNFTHEIKWTNCKRESEAFYLALVEEFFKREWLMFHCLVVRKTYIDSSKHKDPDEALQKHFAMLIKKKVEYFSKGYVDKAYHVRVDPLPVRYKKADEAAKKILDSTFKKELGITPIKTLITRDSKQSPGIQLADALLGATLFDWQGQGSAPHKRNVARSIAAHLGWTDTKADTRPEASKFNIWSFHDPTGGLPRTIETRSVQLKYPMFWRRRADR